MWEGVCGPASGLTHAANDAAHNRPNGHRGRGGAAAVSTCGSCAAASAWLTHSGALQQSWGTSAQWQ